ncbi:glycosyl transferase family 2 [Aliidiomarina minuta]|uniref:Glycosyl transferase family 2 n=1 Tax=Aliidiomarina minuta TaxID=880057 RepID=A0A432W9J6_9GAMM|nr:glycosyltransferase [Aliidiomarina minuta]RUO26268.1 glycosyl transferase family 2 [Aliidiomarina minuta]
MRKNLRSEKEIMSFWQGDVSKPLVSISCTTYNHEKFIEDALEGFLIQETDFPFEIIIHDDASTDRTQDIIKEYQYAYPNLIRTILQTENQYSEGRKPGGFLFSAYQGKYVANCEGDDYWTDKDKLQIQVGFLEQHPEYVISCHDATIIDSSGNVLSKQKLPSSCRRDFDENELLSGRAWILTMSRVYRREISRIPESKYIKNGDTFFAALMGLHGKCKFHPEISPAMYRVHDGGIWSSTSQEDRTDDHINTWFWMYRYFKRTGNEKYADLYFRRCFQQLSANIPLYVIFTTFIKRMFFFNSFKNLAIRKLGLNRLRSLRDSFSDRLRRTPKK